MAEYLMHGTFNLREILKDQKIRHDFGSIMPGDKHFLFYLNVKYQLGNIILIEDFLL